VPVLIYVVHPEFEPRKRIRKQAVTVSPQSRRIYATDEGILLGARITVAEKEKQTKVLTLYIKSDIFCSR